MVSSRLPPAPMRTAAEVVAEKGEEEEEEEEGRGGRKFHCD